MKNNNTIKVDDLLEVLHCANHNDLDSVSDRVKVKILEGVLEKGNKLTTGLCLPFSYKRLGRKSRRLVDKNLVLKPFLNE